MASYFLRTGDEKVLHTMRIESIPSPDGGISYEELFLSRL